MSIQTNGERAFRIFSAAVMILITLIAFLPFVLILMSSITDEKFLVSEGFSFIPGKLSMDAYIYLYGNFTTFARAYGVSIFVTFVGTVLSLFITSLLAYPMSRGDFKYRNILAFVVFFTMLFKGGVVPSYILWSKYFSVKDTLAALIFPNLLLNGFNVLLVRNYFKHSVPFDLVESAQLDGATELKIYYKIMLPLSIPVMATIGLFTALLYWNDWINALYYITEPQYYGIQNLLIRMMNNIQYLKSSEASSMLGSNVMELPSNAVRMAMAVAGVLPIVIILPFLQKYLTKGVVIGAVKG